MSTTAQMAMGSGFRWNTVLNSNSKQAYMIHTFQEVSRLSVLKLHIPYEEWIWKNTKNGYKHVYVFIDFM